ncbi:MAG: hypothetical protein ASARMPRED_006603 [Alectoria sarmentosa]|nr:MAG: hypothetical protein ASARMPRED_006603 [Alectoria sarmentosa]
MVRIRAFINARICAHGRETLQDFYVDLDTGYIVKEEPSERSSSVIDMHNRLIAPAFQELQINGCLGVHFTTFMDPRSYLSHLENVSRHLVTQGDGGVSAFYVTLPTVSRDVYKKILPHLKPRAFDNGADLLGAHCEGPWLNPLKKGAHDTSLMQSPAESSVGAVYGDEEALSAVKMVTLAPELQTSQDLVQDLVQRGVIVSLGHSAADYDTGTRALGSGAKMITHAFNAMNPFSHRSPGIAGLISSSEAPYFSIIADGIHLHPATATLAFRANPSNCILVSDAIEMAGLPDGLYAGHAQIPHGQRKVGNKVTIEGTDTLVGSCSTVAECVRNLRAWSGCSLAEAVRCASQNVTSLMKDQERGLIEEGRKADFVVLSERGYVQETWMMGMKLFEKTDS